MEGKLFLDTLLKSHAFFKGERVGLCDDWDDVDDVRKLFQDNDVDGLEGMARWLDEEKAAVDTGILNVTFSLSGQFLPEITRVLVLDILDNWIPADSLSAKPDYQT